MLHPKAVLLRTLLISGLSGASSAQAAELPGYLFAKTYCSRCHSIEKTGPSPLAQAPPFRSLSERFAMDDLADQLTDGDLGSHPTMPNWLLDPADVKDLVAYIGSIQP